MLIGAGFYIMASSLPLSNATTTQLLMVVHALNVELQALQKERTYLTITKGHFEGFKITFLSCMLLTFVSAVIIRRWIGYMEKADYPQADAQFTKTDTFLRWICQCVSVEGDITEGIMRWDWRCRYINFLKTINTAVLATVASMMGATAIEASNIITAQNAANLVTVISISYGAHDLLPHGRADIINGAIGSLTAQSAIGLYAEHHDRWTLGLSVVNIVINSLLVLILSIIDIDNFVPDIRMGNLGFMRKMVSIEELPYKYLVVCYRLSEPARAGRDIATILSCIYSVLSLVFFYVDHGRYTRADEHIVAIMPLATMLGGYIFHRIHDVTSRSIIVTDQIVKFYDTISHQASADAILEADRVWVAWQSWFKEDINRQSTLKGAAPDAYCGDSHGPWVERDEMVLISGTPGAASAATAGQAADALDAATAAAGHAADAKAAAIVAGRHVIAVRAAAGIANVSAATRHALAAAAAADRAADDSAAAAVDASAAASAYTDAAGEAADRAADGRAAADAAAVDTSATEAAATAAAAGAAAARVAAAAAATAAAARVAAAAAASAAAARVAAAAAASAAAARVAAAAAAICAEMAAHAATTARDAAATRAAADVNAPLGAENDTAAGGNGRVFAGAREPRRIVMCPIQQGADENQAAFYEEASNAMVDSNVRRAISEPDSWAAADSANYNEDISARSTSECS